MAVYGADLYGKALYGAPLAVGFTAGQVVAEQWDYGALRVTWSTPQNTATGPAGFKGFTGLRLLRNPYGIPGTETDGLVLLDEPAATGSTSYLDTTCTPGRYYYYAVFVATSADPYQSAYTYAAGDRATYGGTTYIALQTALGQQPNTSPLYWAASAATTTWVRAGAACGLSPRNYGNAARLYNLIPRPYRVAETETTASDIAVNSPLQKFMTLFGFYADIVRSENETLRWLSDSEKMTDTQLYYLAGDLGITEELPTLPHLRRRYVRQAASLTDRRGSADGLADLVTAITGWKADVTVGYNMMLNLDQAEFNAPVYPAWDVTTPYMTGDYVTYGGYLYKAASGPTTRINATTLTLPSGTAVSAGGTVVQQASAALSSGSHYLMSSSAAGQWMELTFSVATAGTYDMSIAFLMGPDYAQIAPSLNGTALTAAPIETYSKTVQERAPSYLGQVSLLAGNNVLRLTATSKNAVSTAYHISGDYWTISPVGVLSSGHAPTGSATSNTYWTYIAPGSATVQATSPELNPLTGGQSTWYTTATSPVSAPQSSQAVSLAGAATARASEGLRNALAVTTGGSGTGDLTLESLGPATASTWSATTAYAQGAMVTYNSQNYRALTPTTGDQPDQSPTRWARTNLTTSASPDPAMVQTYGIPLPYTPPWSASIAYSPGTSVSWRGHLYTAGLDAPIGQAPTGYASDNVWWRWVSRDVPVYTFSMWQYRTATTTGQYVRAFVDWWDAYGTYLATAATSDTAFFMDRFEVDQTYPRSTGSAPTGTVTAAAQQTGVPIPWNTSVGDWAVSNGLAYPTSWYDTSTQAKKAGRALWFDRSWVVTLTTGDVIYATFISAPSDPTYEQGVIFRWGGGTYLMASRTRLTKMVVTSSGGLVTGTTLTVLGTYANGFTFANGQRIRVVVTPTNITVYNVTGKGPSQDTQLLTVANTDNASAYGVGLLERSP